LKTRRKKPALRLRKSFDAKLAALAPQEQLHQLFHGRPSDGGFFETQLRALATWRRLDELRELPTMNAPSSGEVLVNGKAEGSRTTAQKNAEYLQAELGTLAAFCRAALKNWQPETLEQIAALMRKIKLEDERAKHFNPFKTACGLESKTYLRAVILSQSKKGAVNQWQIACHFENTNPNPKLQSAGDFIRTDSTRKTVGEICKRLKVRSKVGRPNVEK